MGSSEFFYPSELPTNWSTKTHWSHPIGFHGASRSPVRIASSCSRISSQDRRAASIESVLDPKSCSGCGTRVPIPQHRRIKTSPLPTQVSSGTRRRSSPRESEHPSALASLLLKTPDHRGSACRHLKASTPLCPTLTVFSFHVVFENTSLRSERTVEPESDPKFGSRLADIARQVTRDEFHHW